MNNDVYEQPTKVFFGQNVEELVGEEVAKYAERVLLHYGGQSAEKSGLLSRVRASLTNAGVAYYELGGVEPNPRLSLVYEGIKMCRENAIGLVLAVGGGSVIDSAKAIAVGAQYESDVWDLFIHTNKVAGAILPVATVLTMPGAGSESSNGMVITNWEKKIKLAYGDERARPKLSFLNPEITKTVPAWHTSAGIADAMAHILERYFTNTQYVDVTDRMCEGVLKSLMKYGRLVVEKPDDYNVRAEIMWACKMAHDGTLGVGRDEDWGCHDIEHELSALYDVTHGAGLTVINPAWMQYVYKHDIGRFTQFAMRVMDVEYDKDNPDFMIKTAIERLKEFYTYIGMPTTLRQLGIEDKTMIKTVAKNAVEHIGGKLGNFVKLDAEDIEKILELAY